MRITFLAHSLDSIGGTIKATINSASALADLGHDVEIATVFRRRVEPLFVLDPRVRVRPLLDETPVAGRAATVRSLSARLIARSPSRIYPAGDTRTAAFNRLADRRVASYLRNCRADVIIGTRPGLNVYVSALAPTGAVRIAQEHLYLGHHKPQLREALSRSYRNIDAVVTVSDADASDYRRQMPHLAEKVWFIPNSITPTTLPTARGDSKLIIAAGRLESNKRFDMLLRAFAEVHHRHPDWRLRIFGHGTRQKALRQLIERLGLGDQVSLMGLRAPLDAEWVKGSIAAVTSRHESFGLTLVEAMDCGLPVVSTACEHGPLEIVSDGADGLLTPPDDVGSFAKGLCQLIEDDILRRQMAQTAHRNAQRYSPATVGAQYVELFERLLAERGTTAARGGRRAPAPTLPAATVPIADVHVTSFEDMTLLGLDGVQRLQLVSPDQPPIWVKVDDGVARFDKVLLRELTEGVWSVHAEQLPLRAGRIDSRALLSPPAQRPGSAVVPFARDGHLALRVWRRDCYAEVETVTDIGQSVTIGGRILGGRPVGSAVLLAVKRKGKRTQLRFDAAIDNGRFEVVIPMAALADHRESGGDLWDLWLACDENPAPIRLARFFDDIAERKQVQRYRAIKCGFITPAVVRPYFTVDNELSVRVKD